MVNQISQGCQKSLAKFFLITALVLGTASTAPASESADLAWRATEAYRTGNYAKAQRTFERALESAQKENNIENKARVATNLARIYVDQLLFNEADSLLTLAKKWGAGSTPITALKVRKDFLANQCINSYEYEENSKDPSYASLLFWTQMCRLAKGAKGTKGNTQFEEKGLGEGMKATLRGVSAAISKDWNTAIEHWQKAVIFARESGFYSGIVDLLWLQAWAYDRLNDTENRQNLLAQSFEAASRIGLPIPMIRAAQKWLEKDTDPRLSEKVAQIKKLLGPSIQPSTLEFP